MGSDYLFAWPSFVSGVARTLDLAGQFDEYNDSQNGEIADWRALFSDWRAVGCNFAEAMSRVIRTAEADGSASKSQ